VIFERVWGADFTPASSSRLDVYVSFVLDELTGPHPSGVAVVGVARG
jgi:hypothetical protein